MGSIKFKFRKSAVQGKEGMLYFQIIHECCLRRIHTGYRLPSDKWDAKTEKDGSVSDTLSETLPDDQYVEANAWRPDLRSRVIHIQFEDTNRP